MKGIVTYLIIYLSVLLFPSFGKGLNTDVYKKRLQLNHGLELKNQQKSHGKTFEFVSENENEENDINLKKEFNTHFSKINKSGLFSFHFESPSIYLFYLNKSRTIQFSHIPIYQSVRNLRI